ncbi:hypothetical protein ACFLFF_08140 [Brevibacillus reuszeri]|nr:hypothetical protein [Brevibacillus reuszeri]
MKKLDGAKFKIPFALIDDTQAIGLGTTEPIMSLYISFSLTSLV